MTRTKTFGVKALAAASVLALSAGVASPSFADLKLTKLSTHKSGTFDEAAAQVVAYDSASKQVFIANTQANTIDILNIADPAKPKKAATIELAAYGGGVNSVATSGGVVAAAVEADDPQAPGKVVFLDADGKFLSQVTVGAMPDMVTFTPDGKTVLTANEGEPSKDYSVDPEGSISVIDISGGADKVTDANVKTADFSAFKDLPEGAATGKPGTPLTQDLEPEYISVSADGKIAYVAVQEHNILAVVDIEKAKVTGLVGLGFKDHSKSPIDASNKDDVINIKTWPVKGVYQPDGIATYTVGGATYVVSANEGDSREYESDDQKFFVNEKRVAKLTLDPDAFPNAEELQADENLGRLKVINTMGDTDGDGDFDELYSFGARSLTIWDANGNPLWDSGDEFERKTAEMYPNDFNSTNDENGSFDNRSDDKGPEPETVVVGEIGGKHYAFVALERMGGIIVYDVSDPKKGKFVTYEAGRDYAGDAEAGTAGDLAPEGLAFVAAGDSPNGKNLLIVGNEVSGTTSIYAVE